MRSILAGMPDAAPAAGATPAGTGQRAESPWPRRLLALVAVAFAAASLAAVGPRLPLLWDESVYVSQVGGHGPASAFDAHRARGIVALVYPAVEAFPSSTAALRTYLAVLAGVGLYLAYLPWLRVRPGPTAPLAAALFGSLWVSLFYGPAVMPNLYVAFGAVSATGWLVLRPPGSSGRTRAVALAASIAFVALMRPTDSLLVLAPLLLATLVVLRGRLRRSSLGALLAGAALGWAPWVIEAYARFAGPLARFRLASSVDGRGWYDLVPSHLRALSGALLCTLGSPCGSLRPAMLAWWCAAALLVLIGLVHALRRRSGTPIALACLVGTTMAVPYLFTIWVVAPRFLLPAYALAAVPAAEGLAALAALASPGPAPRRWAAASVLALAFAASAVVQVRTAHAVAQSQRAPLAAEARAAAELTAAGVRQPCAMFGDLAQPIAFRAGCYGDWRGGGGRMRPDAPVRAALLRGERVAVLRYPYRPLGAHAYLRSWLRLSIRVPALRLDAFLSPRRPAG